MTYIVMYHCDVCKKQIRKDDECSLALTLCQSGEPSCHIEVDLCQKCAMGVRKKVPWLEAMVQKEITFV